MFRIDVANLTYLRNGLQGRLHHGGGLVIVARLRNY